MHGRHYGRPHWIRNQITNGFGYDPIFYLPEYGMTSAEITPEEKNAISHRGKALHKMQQELKKEFKDDTTNENFDCERYPQTKRQLLYGN